MATGHVTDALQKSPFFAEWGYYMFKGNELYIWLSEQRVVYYSLFFSSVNSMGDEV